MSPFSPQIVPEPLPFQEAITYFTNKIPVTPEEFNRLAANARVSAFTITKAQSALQVAGVKESLQVALEKGSSFGEWKKHVNEIYDSLGVTKMNPFHMDVVYRQNIQQSYMAGRYWQMTNPEVLKRRPYWQYLTVRDDHRRPSHRRQHGKIYPANHPYWNTWYPTNGFRCRCTVVSLSAAEIEERGLTVEEQLPMDLPDGGFEGNHASGHYGDRVGKAIRKDMETFVPVYSGGYGHYGRPAKIPSSALLESPEGLLSAEDLQRTMTTTEISEFYRQAYRKEMGIPVGFEFADVPDALGQSINFNMGGLEYLIGKGDGRERFIPFVKPAIENPYEVWLVETKTATGNIRYRKRYVAGFEGREGAHLVVVDEFEPNRWGIWNAYPMEPSRVNRERNGVLLFGR